MDSVKLSILPSQGYNTQNISDVWVEANSSNLGAYELPANFPVLLSGRTSFVVSPGIWVGGQSEVRDIYPFYEPDTFTIDAVPGQKYSHIPKFTYKTGISFAYIDNFETGNNFSNLTVSNDTNLKYGLDYGRITVTTADSDVIAQQKSSTAFTLPNGQEIWLELDYKADVPFWVGFVGNYSSSQQAVPIELVLQKSYWNKIYIKFSNAVGSSPANSYMLYFEAVKPVGSSAGSVYLDNIKLVHY
jgi:hypothetical protein